MSAMDESPLIRDTTPGYEHELAAEATRGSAATKQGDTLHVAEPAATPKTDNRLLQCGVRLSRTTSG